ncbi:hypothetical protein C5E44_29435 [Nocardia nova]|uniref:hypothetical protein n=1 Tax=Nocardia nova TaxID=37330 RepID=UPI000CE9EE30|nr:hypothetical protein C5E44_29435 [Nocardia nova]
MDRWRREALRSANSGLRNQVEAARRARRQSEAAAASVAADLDDQPDLPDILDESPMLRDIREFFRGTDTSAGGTSP